MVAVQPNIAAQTAQPYNGSALQDGITVHFARVRSNREHITRCGAHDEMAAVLPRAAARAKRSGGSGMPLRSVLVGRGPFSSEAATTPPPAAAAATGEEDGDDLRSRIFRLGLAKRSATAALERWSGEGRAAPAEELRRIARDLSRVRRYKHALEVRSPPAEPLTPSNCSACLCLQGFSALSVQRALLWSALM